MEAAAGSGKYVVLVPLGSCPGSLVAVQDQHGALRGYAEVPTGVEEGGDFEVRSDDGGVMDFDSPGFPLFARLAKSRGAFDDSFVPQDFEPEHWRRVRGRSCWLGCWAVTFALGAVIFVCLSPKSHMLQTLAMYVLTFIASACFIFSMWWEHRFELQPGVLIAIFWTSGTVGVGCAAFLNWSALHIWPAIDPFCHPLHPLGKNWPEESPSLACVTKASVEWMLMAGLIEETVKFAALWRLLPTPQAASWSCIRRRRPRLRVLGRLLQSWWVRLAPTPYAFAAASLASGGGLATIENFHYIFFDAEAYEKSMESGDLSHALGRIVSSCAHIVWTGLAGIELAKWHFLPEGHPKRPRRAWSGLVFPIVCHGLFDVCSVLRTCYPEEHCMEWPPESERWVCGHCVLPPLQRLMVGFMFQVLFISSGLLFHHKWTYELLEVSVESCSPSLLQGLPGEEPELAQGGGDGSSSGAQGGIGD